jgi:hypothetical protein
VLLSIGAGMMHGLNVQEHLAEWWGYGFFFLFAAAGQFLYGLVLIVQPWNYDQTGGRRDGGGYARAFYRAGIVGNCFLILLYHDARPVGIPWLGPEAGETEPFTTLGILTKGLEGCLVVCLWVMTRSSKAATAISGYHRRTQRKGS